MASRGRVYDPKRPTTPAAGTVNTSAIFARPYATARYARYSLFRAARIDPSEIWKHVWDVVSATLSTTRTANSWAAAALLTRTITANTQPPCSRTSSDSDIGPVDTLGVIQGNSQPSMTPTNSGRDNEAIRISRNGPRANPVMILPDRGCRARARPCD